MKTGAMRSALERGDAESLGELPGSPVAYADEFWVESDQGWSQVDDQETVTFLRDAQRRLLMANQAADEPQESQ